MNIDIDYGRKLEGKEGEITNAELTVDYINFSVKSFYKEGLESQWRRTFARIQRKLDEALDKKAYEVNFEQGEIDFIKRAMKEAKFPAELSKYVIILEDILERKND